MNNQKLYLKQNVAIEPLFNQWYAWSYLISPATAAMYVANYYLKIMQSFVTTPQVHISALKSPEMMGGPFINCGISKINEIKALIEKTLKEQSQLLEFAEAIKKLDTILIKEADGCSLESTYQKVPEILKGYIELVYDLNNNPSVRFIEGLLYKSLYYNELSQSIALFLIKDDNRSFAFSSPKLKDNETLHLNIPFHSQVIDELVKMKNIPDSLSLMRDKLMIQDEDKDLFSSFFTEEPPPTVSKFNDDGVKISYFGHACILIESKDISILCDPVISYKYDHEIARYTFSDLPESIDYVLITHNHQDHCLFETLLHLRYKIKNIIVPRNNGGGLVDPSLKLILQKIGFKTVREIDEMEIIDFDEGFIQGLPFFGEHADLNIRTKMAYCVRLQNHSILIAADSNNIEPKLYKNIHDFLENDIEVLFLGMECAGAPLSWLYGSLLTKPLTRKADQSRRLDGSNYKRGMDIVRQLNPKQVYVYAMGQEPWLSFITSIQYTEKSRPIIESNQLIEDCRKQGIVAERLFGQKELLLL